MNSTFQATGLLGSCLVSLILMPFALAKWLTQIFVQIATDLIKVK